MQQQEGDELAQHVAAPITAQYWCWMDQSQASIGFRWTNHRPVLPAPDVEDLQRVDTLVQVRVAVYLPAQQY